jgi:hypothetical protein
MERSRLSTRPLTVSLVFQPAILLGIIFLNSCLVLSGKQPKRH